MPWAPSGMIPMSLRDLGHWDKGFPTVTKGVAMTVAVALMIYYEDNGVPAEDVCLAAEEIL